MVFGAMIALSSILSVLVCACTGAFDTLDFLWLLPVSFAGSFLLAALLAFGVFSIICAFIDPDKPREQDSPWFRAMVLSYVDAILKILPIRIRKQGFEQPLPEGRFLLVCNHLELIDPALLLHVFPKSQLAFVGKKEASSMIFINKVMPKLLCPYINRENDREALKTILRCISLLKNDTVSVAIFPEGRINPYRRLAHFRPGVFKIAQKANVPIVVCTIRNTHRVLPQLLKLKSSTVDMHCLGVVSAEEVCSKTTVELSEYIYAMMAEDLGPENILTPEEENT